MGNLVGIRDPYVHSYINRFETYGSGIYYAPGRGNVELDQGLKRLKSISDQLRNMTNKVIGDKSWQDFSKDIFEKPDTYRGIANEIFQRPLYRQLILSAANTIQEDTIEKTFMNNPEIIDIVKREAFRPEDGTYGLQKAAEAVIEAIGDDIFPTTSSGDIQIISAKTQRSILGDAFSGLEAKVKEDILKDINRRHTSRQGQIQMVVRRLLKAAKSEEIQTSELILKKIWPQFEKDFYDLLGARVGKDAHIADQSPKDFLDKMLAELKKTLPSNISQASDVSGFIGEPVIHSILKSDSSIAFELELIGGKTEIEARKLQQAVSQTIRDAGFTYKDSKKLSYSDFVLRANGITVRVQSKNYMALFDKIIKEGRDLPIFAQLQGSIRYLDLVNRLIASGHSLSNQAASELSYYIANIMWFNQYGGRGYYRRKSTGATTQTVLRSSMSVQQENMEKILSYAAQELLGIVFDRDMARKGANIVVPDYSNIFYLFGNRYLIPTYTIIDEFIKFLAEGEDQLANLQIAINPNSVHPGIRDINEYYTQKALTFTQNSSGLAVMEGASNKYEAPYANPALVKVGKTQGRSIIDRLSLKRINLKLNFNLVGASYKSLITQR